MSKDRDRPFPLKFLTKNRLFLRPVVFEKYFYYQSTANGLISLLWNCPNKWTVPIKPMYCMSVASTKAKLPFSIITVTLRYGVEWRLHEPSKFYFIRIICFNPINVKTTKLTWSNFCCGNSSPQRRDGERNPSENIKIWYTQKGDSKVENAVLSFQKLLAGLGYKRV